ncbi:hypothetical protein Tco_0122988, partial [Tanacetum coccineum]
AQENEVVLDEMQLLFTAGGQDSTFVDDLDEPPVQDLALNIDQVFQADQCYAFDFDVDEALTAQTIFMANLSSADPIYDEVGPLYDSDILSENYVVDSDAEYTSDGNIIPYEQYVKDNAVQVVQSNVSFMPNDALMMIINDMHEQAAQFKTNHAPAVVHDLEDTLEISEITRKKMLKKMKSTLWIEEGERGFEQTKECYLTEVIPFFKTLKEHFEGIQTALVKEVKEMKEIFEQMEAEVEQNDVDKQCADIERKNLLIQNENLIANWLSNEVLHSVMSDGNTISRFFEMHDAYTVEQARSELSKLKHKIQKNDHSEMIKRFSNLEIDHLNLQLKYQNLKERVGNNKSQPSQDTPEFDTVFETNKMKASLQGKDNAIRKLKEQISQMNERRSEADRILDFKALDFQNIELTEKVTSLQEQNKLFRAENEKLKQHYKELYDSIKITHAKTIEKTTSLLTENEKLKAHIKGTMPCVTMPTEKPKVLTPGMYAIDVEPIPPRNRNNREVHLDYLKHLKESELLEYVIGTCPKEVSKRDKKVATAPLNKKKQVTFKEPCDTSRVNSFNEASRSKPRSNTKNNRILPAKSENKKKVEAHPRNNKSKLKQKNRVDSSINYKRTVINSNSNSVCKTCNKCLISANHDKCVVKYLKSISAPTAKNVSSTVKQVWKATRKIFANVGYQWKPTGRKFTLGEHCPLTRFTKSKLMPLKKPEHVSSSKIMITERFNNTSQKPLTRYKRKNKQEKAISNGIHTTAETQSIDDSMQYTTISTNQQNPNRNWGSIIPNSIFVCFQMQMVQIVLWNDNFGAIMGYGYYVIGDSVISQVYYVEGLGHDLFSVGQFCNSDLEVAFRKHSCYVRDVDCVELLKGSRGSNIYTISVKDMMKSSPICLLSKASKNKSWLWNR